MVCFKFIICFQSSQDRIRTCNSYTATIEFVYLHPFGVVRSNLHTHKTYASTIPPPDCFEGEKSSMLSVLFNLSDYTFIVVVVYFIHSFCSVFLSQGNNFFRKVEDGCVDIYFYDWRYSPHRLTEFPINLLCFVK